MPYVLVRTDTGAPVYYSLTAGRLLPNPTGGWSVDKNEALQFARQEDGEQFMEKFQKHAADMAEVRRI